MKHKRLVSCLLAACCFLLSVGWIAHEYLLPGPIVPVPIRAVTRDQARSALQEFFSLLHNGQYKQATRLYGGDYQVLREANPDVSPDDYALLFERACRQNGFQCLEIKSIVEQTLQSATETRFTVEFTAADGQLFVRGPCCGATEAEMPSVSQFIYTVKKVSDSFLIQELPVYVP